MGLLGCLVVWLFWLFGCLLVGLFACWVVCLLGCWVVWLFDCLLVWLFGSSVVCLFVVLWYCVAFDFGFVCCLLGQKVMH
jgi:hypothetical protein